MPLAKVVFTFYTAGGLRRQVAPRVRHSWRAIVKNMNQENNNISTNSDPDKQKMPIGKKVLWIITAVIIFIAVVQIAVADKYQAQVLVIAGEKKVGVNPTAEKLDFGDLSADTSAIRYVTLTAGGMDTFISIIKFGSISELIKLSENNFIITKGDEKKIEFSLYMPPSAPVEKKYTGRVWIFKMPKIW